jgi:hypothetical protein
MPAAPTEIAECKPEKNRQFCQKQKTWKRMKINASGSRSGGIIVLRLPATDMVATPHCGARFLSVEKGFDEISATGGHRILSPRPFGPEFEDLDFRPSNANFRHFPPVVQ